MTRSGIYSSDIFKVADACIEMGCFPRFEDKHYVLLLSVEGMPSCEVRRAHVDFLLPGPCRIWLAKGARRFLLGDSHSLPADLSCGVRPPYVG